MAIPEVREMSTDFGLVHHPPRLLAALPTFPVKALQARNSFFSLKMRATTFRRNMGPTSDLLGSERVVSVRFAGWAIA